jgi:hypothetical protein
MEATEDRIDEHVWHVVEEHLFFYRLYKQFTEEYAGEREDVIEAQMKPEVGYARGRGSTVEAKALLLGNLDAKYAHHSRWVRGIEDVLATLSRTDRRYVELRYFTPEDQRLPESIIARELHCHRDTLRARRQYIIRAVAVRMGLV